MKAWVAVKLLRKNGRFFRLMSRALALCASVVGWGVGPAGSATNADSWQAAPTAIVQEVTQVPQSVFKSAASLQPTVSAPVILKDSVR